MENITQVLAELKTLGREQTRKTYARHGIEGDVYGVSIADLKQVAKKIKGNQDLACELFASGNFDAMYLAGIVANGGQMTKKQLDSWAKTSPGSMISEYSIPGVVTESPHARSLAMKWLRSKKESIAACGWATYAGIVAINEDEELDLAEVQDLLDEIATEIHGKPNRVRYSMNGFVIAVGAYVKPLSKRARAVAKQIGKVSVDMGDTACKVPDALTYLDKIEAKNGIGKKRKTIKC